VVQEFETDTHRAKTMELLNLKQVGSVEDYQRSFEQLIYHIKLFGVSLSDTMLTTQFLLGLRDDIIHHVEMMLLETMAKAATLAAIVEHLMEKTVKHHRPFITRKSGATDKQDNKSSFSPTELW
jgi:hypothetical protein